MQRLLELREEEVDISLAAKKEYYRKLSLMTSIWRSLFPVEQRQEAEQRLHNLQDESIGKMLLVEYLGYTYETNAEHTEVEFIKYHLAELKILIEFILGYRPELEKNLSESVLNDCKAYAEAKFIKQMNQNLNFEDSN